MNDTEIQDPRVKLRGDDDARLSQLKRKHNPASLLRVNQSIEPGDV